VTKVIKKGGGLGDIRAQQQQRGVGGVEGGAPKIGVIPGKKMPLAAAGCQFTDNAGGKG